MSVSYLVVRKRLEKRKSSQQNQLSSQDLLTDPLTDPFCQPLRASCTFGTASRTSPIRSRTNNKFHDWLEVALIEGIGELLC
jgi:hypothetical protein